MKKINTVTNTYTVLSLPYHKAVVKTLFEIPQTHHIYYIIYRQDFDKTNDSVENLTSATRDDLGNCFIKILDDSWKIQ